MDSIYEQLLTSKKKTTYKLMTVFLFGINIVLLLVLLKLFLCFSISGLIETIVIIGIDIILINVRNKQYREYEYTFINGNLQIDVIYNMKKRKMLMEEDIRNFEQFGSVSEIGTLKSVKHIKCFPDDGNSKYENVYTVVLTGHRKMAYYIKPDEKMVKLIKTYYRKKN